MDALIRLVSVTKRYASPGNGGDATPPVLDAIDCEIRNAETVVIRGESGSGKTTLLNLIAGLDRPTEGEVWVDGKRLDGLEDHDLARFRRETVGIVFQAFHLEKQLTTEENVALPLLLSDVPWKEAKEKARDALTRVGMADFIQQKVALLSGGQSQRVVVARAIVRRPRILLADEPTANLDEKTARDVLSVLKEYQKSEFATLILVSHDRLALDHPEWRQAICAKGKLLFPEGKTVHSDSE